MTPAGFPHSEISGSTPVSGSPKLFAADHVLHRLLTPRHPPCALSSLTYLNLLHASISLTTGSSELEIKVQAPLFAADLESRLSRH